MHRSSRVSHRFLMHAIAIAVIAILAVWIGGRQWSSNDVADDNGQSRIGKNLSDQRVPGSSSRGSQSSRADNNRAYLGESETSSTSIDTVNESGAASVHYRPIPLPAEFAQWAEGDSELAQFHRMLEREAEDAEWAMGLERELQDLLSASLDPSTVTVGLLECRSKSCEILASGYGEQALKDWMSMANEMYASGMLEEWAMGSGAESFDGGCGAGQPQPGIYRLNCQFTLVGQQTNQNSDIVTLSLAAPYPDGVEFERVAVSDVFAPMIESDVEFYEFHRALEMESTDQSWSSYIEQNFVEHFAAIPELESLQFVQFECRMTRCEILLTIDVSAVAPWTTEMQRFDELPWHDLTYTVHGDEIEDGLLGIIWLLQRQPDE